jgi:hypothetical protein
MRTLRYLMGGGSLCSVAALLGLPLINEPANAPSLGLAGGPAGEEEVGLVGVSGGFCMASSALAGLRGVWVDEDSAAPSLSLVFGFSGTGVSCEAPFLTPTLADGLGRSVEGVWYPSRY